MGKYIRIICELYVRSVTCKNKFRISTEQITTYCTFSASINKTLALDNILLEILTDTELMN